MLNGNRKLNLNFSAYSFQYPIKPNLSLFSSVEGEKLNAFYSIPLYINVSQLGIHYFLASIIFPVILFKKLMLKKKKKTRKEKPNFQTKKKNKKSWNRAMFWDEMLSRCLRESMSSRILGSHGINLNDIRPPVLTT